VPMPDADAARPSTNTVELTRSDLKNRHDVNLRRRINREFTVLVGTFSRETMLPHAGIRQCP
jgi:hypothetical protein